MLRRIVCTVFLAGIVPLATTSAWGQSLAQGRRAADWYIQARYKLEQSVGMGLSEDRQGVQREERSVALACYGVLDAAPAGAGLETILREAFLVTMLDSEGSGMKHAIGRFLHNTAHLYVGGPRIRHLIAALRLEDQARINVAPANICHDAVAWRDAKYAALRRTTTRFLEKVTGSTESMRDAAPIGAVVLHEVRHYAKNGEVANKVSHLETEVEAVLDGVLLTGFERVRFALGAQ